MKLGTVKWFNNSKGYGFIRTKEGGEDLFVHFSYIEMEGYKTLKAGQAVSFEMTPTGKGIHATHIKKAPSAELDDKPSETEPSETKQVIDNSSTTDQGTGSQSTDSERTDTQDIDS